MTRFLSLLLLLIVIIGSYLAFTGIKPEPDDDVPEPKEWVMDHSLAMYLEEFAESFEAGLNEEQIPGAAVVIVKEGRVVFQKGFGVKERGKPEKLDEHTVFRLGSVSKGFAAVLTGVCILINTNLSYPLTVIPDFFNHFQSSPLDNFSD